ncbi:tetratricopeptide repeat protein [Paludisphaera soli]|uniref:tetratricopeptide repeat protein n=1 Tax=Paludisphaera soli TaxID=2712865 RepID=UPI0013EA7E83|nr:tetratricopeptide repeat protein [Paludisphaera soli]
MDRPPSRRQAARRWLLRLALAAPAAVAVTTIVSLPGWLPLLSRPVRRALTEGLLETAVLFHAVLILVGLVGTPSFAWLGLRARRLRRPAGANGRLFLLGVSCLLALGSLELGAAAVRSRIHRFPDLPATFPAEDPATYRIVVLGGSSALGEPYRPWVSVGAMIAWKLGEAVPGRRFEVETLAWLGESLEQQHHKLARITRRPDAVIVYSGHNEFVARYEEDRAYEPGLDASSVVRLVHRLGAASPFVRLTRELISKNRLDAPPSLKDRHQVVDPPLCSPAEAREVLDDFSARLEAIVAYCERIGAQPILIIPPANEADYEPGRSTVEPGVDEAERARVADEFLAARASEASDPDRAHAAYRAILERHPGFAEAHYRIGRRLRDRGRIDEAREAFLRALDLDGLPIRCPAPFREAYRAVAEGRPNCILVDGRRELSEASPTGLLDDQVVEDTHHPNLRGYIALAAAVLRELKVRGTFGAESAAIAAPDVAGCLARFGLDADRLAQACDRTSLHYQRVAGYRYDPTERLARSRRFAEAARRLRAGEPIEGVGLPAFDPEGSRK